MSATSDHDRAPRVPGGMVLDLVLTIAVTVFVVAMILAFERRRAEQIQADLREELRRRREMWRDVDESEE
ncbi:hypothetical protein [Nocardioides sp. R-C-SC26]|uniref:hypothetical protein n=1 Tax=Nocardioides sp. R-C-SC26 TaxID=2870414 RepID=UPI001E5520E9|nr:hypothetical protein [Nocardioides sp. R-C-SC26]